MRGCVSFHVRQKQSNTPWKVQLYLLKDIAIRYFNYLWLPTFLGWSFFEWLQFLRLLDNLMMHFLDNSSTENHRLVSLCISSSLSSSSTKTLLKMDINQLDGISKATTALMFLPKDQRKFLLKEHIVTKRIKTLLKRFALIQTQFQFCVAHITIFTNKCGG